MASPQVAVIPFPAQGHLPPMLHLSSELAKHGLGVTLLNFSSVHSTLCKTWSCPPGVFLEKLEEGGLHLPHGVPSEAVDADLWIEGMTHAALSLESFLAEVSPKPSYVVCDYFLVRLLRVPKKFGIPTVVYFPGSAAYSTVHHHLDLLVKNGALKEGFRDVIHYVPGIPALEAEDVPDYLKAGPRLEMFFSEPDRMKNAEWILVNSMEELEPETFRAMREAVGNRNFIPVAPLMKLTGSNPQKRGSLREEDMSCISWLDQQMPDSVLYISFGSLARISDELLQELALGLEASKRPFLWVLRKDLTAGLTGKAGDGNAGLPPGFLERTSARGLVVGWAPQLAVLAHNSVGGFLSHCGWNSVMESLCNGVPLLCWPCAFDQTFNATRVVERFRFGQRFPRNMNQLKHDEVEHIISSFMDDAELRHRVRAFRDARSQNPGLEKFIAAAKVPPRLVVG